MRLAITLLGLDLFTIELETAAAECYEAVDDSPGDCTTYPIGFTAAHEIPDEAGPYREGWE